MYNYGKVMIKWFRTTVFRLRVQDRTLYHWDIFMFYFHLCSFTLKVESMTLLAVPSERDDSVSIGAFAHNFHRWYFAMFFVGKKQTIFQTWIGRAQRQAANQYSRMSRRRRWTSAATARRRRFAAAAASGSSAAAVTRLAAIVAARTPPSTLIFRQR